MKKVFVFLSLIVVLSACGSSGSKPAAPASRAFPYVAVPDMISDPEERYAYAVEHYWDKFFEGEWPTDSSHVLGVSDNEMTKGLATFVGLLDYFAVEDAQKLVGSLFNRIETRQAADTTSLFYLRMTDFVSDCLYNPNSMLRSEDLYLPFVEGLVSSRFTDEARRKGYEFELKTCRMNPYGTQVPDFEYMDAKGRKGTLYGVKAQYTMLFFSNPGCGSCHEIIDEITSRPYVDELIEQKALAVVNIYVDEDLESWRVYEPEYPDNWINAYDPYQRINEGDLYFVRAIPSLYLLDEQKRVILKDAPTERVLAVFDQMTNYI